MIKNSFGTYLPALLTETSLFRPALWDYKQNLEMVLYLHNNYGQVSIDGKQQRKK